MVGTLKAKVDGEWVPISMAGPQGAPGPQGADATLGIGSPIAGGTVERVLFTGDGPAIASSSGLTYNPANGLLANAFHSTPLSPATFVTNQHDWSPPVAMQYRISGDNQGRHITGLNIGQIDGQAVELWNVGAYFLYFDHESASSAAANRILTPTLAGASHILAPGRCATLRWFQSEAAGVGRWRVDGVPSWSGSLEMPGGSFAILTTSGTWVDIPGWALGLPVPGRYKFTLDVRGVLQDSSGLANIIAQLKLNGIQQTQTAQLVTWCPSPNIISYAQSSKASILDVTGPGPHTVVVQAMRNLSGTAVAYTHLFSDTNGRSHLTWERIPG